MGDAVTAAIACRLCVRPFSAQMVPFMGGCGHSLCQDCSRSRHVRQCPFCGSSFCWLLPQRNETMIALLSAVEVATRQNEATISTLMNILRQDMQDPASQPQEEDVDEDMKSKDSNEDA